MKNPLHQKPSDTQYLTKCLFEKKTIRIFNAASSSHIKYVSYMKTSTSLTFQSRSDHSDIVISEQK